VVRFTWAVVYVPRHDGAKALTEIVPTRAKGRDLVASLKASGVRASLGRLVEGVFVVSR
jgi:hypothetical protein